MGVAPRSTQEAEKNEEKFASAATRTHDNACAGALVRRKKICAAVTLAKSGGYCSKDTCEVELACAMVIEAAKPAAATCVTPKKVGEACSAVFECAGFELQCTAGMCASLPKTGDACATKAEAPVAQCMFNSSCVSNKSKCIKDVRPTEGEACPSYNCVSGSTCTNDVCIKNALPVCK